MKYLKLFILGLFLFSFMFVSIESVLAQTSTFKPYRKLCVGIQGKFIANSTWKGGAIQVGCGGDDGGRLPQSRRAAEACLGEVQIVQPGKPFRLTMCSCFGSDKGCLKIGKDLKREPLNADKRRTITVVKRIDEMPQFINNNCTRKRTGEVCGSNGERIEANIVIKCEVPTKTATPTPTGEICPVPEPVKNVKITCPDCVATPTPEQDN